MSSEEVLKELKALREETVKSHRELIVTLRKMTSVMGDLHDATQALAHEHRILRSEKERLQRLQEVVASTRDMTEGDPT